MELFFDPEFESNQYILSEFESKHCINVLRHKVGDAIRLTDGKGNLFVCSIINAHPKRCQLLVDEKLNFPIKLPHIHIAIAPTKNMDRLEWFIEKATEIGISEITPVICHHSERKQIRIDRLEKVMVSAMKQSLKYQLPILNEAMLFNDLISKPFAGQRFIAHCADSERALLSGFYKKNTDAILLIGPEGDFSSSEIQSALKVGFKPVSLGDSRLRTETAGVVGCATMAILNEM